MPTLPDHVKAVLDKPVFVHLATINPDGSPHNSVVWVERRGDHIVFSTAEGRVKARNVRHDPRVSLSFTDPDDPYRAFTIQAEVVALEHAGRELIDRLAGKYLGAERFDGVTPGQVRLDVTLAPVRVAG